MGFAPKCDGCGEPATREVKYGTSGTLLRLCKDCNVSDPFSLLGWAKKLGLYIIVGRRRANE